jgi:hypothetical protein
LFGSLAALAQKNIIRHYRVLLCFIVSEVPQSAGVSLLILNFAFLIGPTGAGSACLRAKPSELRATQPKAFINFIMSWGCSRPQLFRPSSRWLFFRNPNSTLGCPPVLRTAGKQYHNSSACQILGS